MSPYHSRHFRCLNQALQIINVLARSNPKAIVVPKLTLSSALAIRSSQRHNSLVDLNSGDDAIVLQDLDKWSAIISLLVEGLMEEDHTTDIVGHLLATGEEQLSVLTPVFLHVLHIDLGQPLAHGACALVRGQDALAGGHNGVGDGAQLILLLLSQVGNEAGHDEGLS